MHRTHRLSWDGAVDADGHILEPSDLWEIYLEPEYRDRALRIVKDDNGLDVLDLDQLAGLFPEDGRRRFLGDNVRDLFEIAA